MKKIILAILTLIWSLGFISSPVFGYMIDGSLNDWGVDLSVSSASNLGYLDLAANKPSGGLDIDVITEDNAYSGSPWPTSVGPGYTQYNTFDTEAIYFDNDAINAYIAVITGLPSTGGTAPGNPVYKPGDIGIDVNRDGTYEFGIDVSSYASGKANFYNNLTASLWNNPTAYSSAKPYAIKTSGLVPYYLAPFAYSGDQNSHYVLETSIPLSYLGLSANPGDPVKQLDVHWTMECGNDFLKLNADVNPVPEPATLTLLGLGLLGLAGIRRKEKLDA